MNHKTKKINIALTWWWTWWHIFPLISIYNYLKKNDEYNFFFVWQEWNIEEKISKKNNIVFLDIPAWKIRRYFDIRNFYEPLKNITWIFFWIFYILKYKIDIVFSKWWYVSLPLCISAFILRKKIYIHESDSITWISNKLIEKIATKIFYTFPNEKINNKKHILSWQILNPKLLEKVKNEPIWINKNLSVLIIAGSQWSTRIFNSIIKIIPDFWDIEFNIILWEKNLHFKENFKKFSNVKIHDFVEQEILWLMMKNTDIAITRWWATTLWELCIFGVHSIIVPLTESAWNHQKINAEYFKKIYWSDILDENKNLEIELFRKLKKYKSLRKSWLNLEWFYKSLEIIKKEIMF